MNPVAPKIPAPTMFDTTSAVALTRPSCRSKPFVFVAPDSVDITISHSTESRACGGRQDLQHRNGLMTRVRQATHAIALKSVLRFSPKVKQFCRGAIPAKRGLTRPKLNTAPLPAIYRRRLR